MNKGLNSAGWPVKMHRGGLLWVINSRMPSGFGKAYDRLFLSPRRAGGASREHLSCSWWGYWSRGVVARLAVAGRVPGTVIWWTNRNKNHIARDFHPHTALGGLRHLHRGTRSSTTHLLMSHSCRQKRRGSVVKGVSRFTLPYVQCNAHTPGP